MPGFSTEALVAWSRRLDDLTTPLTRFEWPRLRLDLRSACANHPKSDALYGVARDCGHELQLDEEDVEIGDDRHVWSDDIDELICLDKIVDYVCLCQDGACSQLGSAREAHDDLWSAVSYEHRRRQRAAHLFPAVMDAWLNTALSLETAEELADGCPNTAQYLERVAGELELRAEGRS